MAHKGELKAIVTTVIPLPPQEEKELEETLQEILGKGKKVILEQKAYGQSCLFSAIESKSPLDDQQWLTYWVLYSFITLFELTFIKLIEWVPFWSYTKLLLTCWLVIQYFSGAAYVYEHFVRPVFVNPQNRTVNIWYVPKMKDLFHMKNDKDVFNKRDDILTAAEKYIQENGSNAFRDIISKADNRRRMPNTEHEVFENDHFAY